jgi:hypothetical protein
MTGFDAMPPQRTSQKAARQPDSIDRRVKFHFLHGDDEAAIERYKSSIVEAHLAREEREENYREIIAPGTQPALKRVLGDLLSELSTVSFLPDAIRVATLYTVQDFFEARATKTPKAKSRDPEAGAKKRTPSDHLADFIERELPGLPAVLIVLAVEDYEKWKRVAPANPVVALARKLGTLRQFRETGLQFAFFDALFARRTAEALTLWRSWQERTSNSPKPLMQLAAQLRLLIQAKTASSGQLKGRGITRERYAKEFMPAEPDKNLFAPKFEWRAEKLTRAAGNFTLGELLAAYEKLEPIQKFAIPLLSDPYVPDRNLLAELWIAEFTSSRD